MNKYSPIDYRRIALANAYGLDKVLFEERIQFIKDHEDDLDSLIDKADEPNIFKVQLDAYRKDLKKLPNGVPVSLDATSSGAMIMSLITDDMQGARLTNLIFEGKRMDLYTELYKTMRERDPELPDNITRLSVKTAVMTGLYASTAMPKEIFGKDVPLFYETMEDMVPKVQALGNAYLNLWPKDKKLICWTMPDGFEIKYKVYGKAIETVQFHNHTYHVDYKTNKPLEKSRALPANVIHSVDAYMARELVNRCSTQYPNILEPETIAPNRDNIFKLNRMINLYHTTNILSVRTLKYIDKVSINLLSEEDKQALIDLYKSLPKKQFKILSIHDCFMCMPNYCQDMRQQMQYICYSLAKGNLLDILPLGDILQDMKPTDEEKETLANAILQSEYIIC